MTDDLPSPKVGKSEGKQELDMSNPYVIVLLDSGIVNEDVLKATGLENVPEYHVLKMFESNESMTDNEFEVQVDHPLAPVAVKNLVDSDVLIKSNDNYSLSPDTKTKLS